jgi:hypothetical protein
MVEVTVRDTVHLHDAIRKVQWDTVVVVGTLVVWDRDMEDDSLTILRHTLDQVMGEIMEVTIMVEGVFDLDWTVFEKKGLLLREFMLISCNTAGHILAMHHWSFLSPTLDSTSSSSSTLEFQK